jgi:hypothetical protein
MWPMRVAGDAIRSDEFLPASPMLSPNLAQWMRLSSCSQVLTMAIPNAPGKSAGMMTEMGLERLFVLFFF